MGSTQPADQRRLRNAVARVLHHPVTELCLLILILGSVALLLAETAFENNSPVQHWLRLVGDVITAIFIVELSARLWVARKKSRFFRRYWIDILAVLPLIRPLRILRVLRLLRLFRAGVLASRRLSAFGGVFRGASSELTLLASFTATLILASSVVLFLAERHSNAELGDLDQTVWFSVFSLIAGEPVGASPQSGVGRSMTLVIMLGGLTVFGVFVATISASMVARLSRRKGASDMDLDELSGHVVVCGWNRAGHNVLRELTGRPSDVVLITETENMPEDVPPEVVATGRLYHLSGDHTRVDVLQACNLVQASAAVLLADRITARPDQDRDARTVLAAMTIERMAPQVFTCAELTNRENATLLKMAGVDEIVVPHEYSGVILGSVSRNRGLVEVLDEILTTTYGNAFHKLDLPGDTAGMTAADLHSRLKREHNAILVSIERAGETGKVELLVNPEPTTPILDGDRAVVIAREPVRLS